jgi:hypothetical protein
MIAVIVVLAQLASPVASSDRVRVVGDLHLVEHLIAQSPQLGGPTTTDIDPAVVGILTGLTTALGGGVLMAFTGGAAGGLVLFIASPILAGAAGAGGSALGLNVEGVPLERESSYVIIASCAGAAAVGALLVTGTGLATNLTNNSTGAVLAGAFAGTAAGIAAGSTAALLSPTEVTE